LNRACKFIFFLALLFLLLFSQNIHAASTFRQAIEVNSTIALTDFQVLIIVDTAALVTAGKMRADGGDIRFTDSDGLTPLPFWIENVSTYVAGASSVTSMNTSNTRIWVRIPSIPINPPDPRKIIHMFYGDPAATSVANGSDTFLFFDDFSGGLGKWTIHKQPAPGNISIIGGYLNCGGGFAGGDYGHTVIGSVNSYNSFTDGVIECLIYMTANSIAEISYRGNFPNNTGYKVRWDQRPNEGMGFLKPPYFTATWRFWDGSGSGVINVSKDGIGFTTGYWFPAKVEVSGHNVKIYQGATAYSCTDAGTWSPPAPSTPVMNRYPGPGEISLQNHYGIWCRYDDIRVRRIAAVEPTTILLGQGNLTVTRIDASQPTVNQGQSGVSVSMQIDNFSDESVSFLGGSLIFSLGSYTQTLIAPPPGTIIPGKGRITASFSVDILPDSPLGDATIDGAAIISGLVDMDGSAALKGNWTIQKPPSLVINQIIASGTAYRGEVNRPVIVNVRNVGEATAYWDSSTLQFTLGDYTAVYPQTAFPVKLFGGASATAIYGVDISPASPIGTSTIDATITGFDGNTLYPIMVTGALLPAEWNIPGEYLRTYQDPFHFNHSQKFNLPKVSSSNVYAQAKGLTPFAEFVVRWLNPSGTQVAFSSPPITANAAGTLEHKFSLGSASPVGNWTVRVTNPLNTRTFCESHFQVVGGASLSALLLLPPTVSVGQTFSSTMTLINTGDTALIDAQPGTIATSGTGLATLVSGPIPPLQDIPVNSQATFTWTWSAQTAGTFVFYGMGYGWDANSFERRLAPSQPQDGSGGLRGDYYDNANFTGAHLVRLDPTVNFNWANGAPSPSMGANTFSVRWTGWVMPEFTENYTFYTNTDDGVRLWINGILIVDQWVNQPATEWSGSIGLTAGEKYPITMEYYENTNDAVAQLSWSSPSTAKAIVPASRLFPTSLIDVLQEAEVHLTPPGTGFYGYYFDQDNFAGPLLVRTDPVVNFNWGTSSPDPSMGVNNFSVRWRAWVIPEYTDTYTFFTTTDDGARLWVNDTMLVNSWVNQGPTTWSGDIHLVAGQKYPLTMEYFENGGGASAQLSWKTPSTPQIIIPEARAIPRPFCVIQNPPNLSVLSVTHPDNGFSQSKRHRG